MEHTFGFVRTMGLPGNGVSKNAGLLLLWPYMVSTGISIQSENILPDLPQEYIMHLLDAGHLKSGLAVLSISTVFIRPGTLHQQPSPLA
jgi:hypothetical protein